MKQGSVTLGVSAAYARQFFILWQPEQIVESRLLAAGLLQKIHDLPGVLGFIEEFFRQFLEVVTIDLMVNFRIELGQRRKDRLYGGIFLESLRAQPTEMIALLVSLGEESADDRFFRGAISSREVHQSFDIISHESGLTMKEARSWQRGRAATKTRNISRKARKKIKLPDVTFPSASLRACLGVLARANPVFRIPIPAPRRFERRKRFEPLERVHFRYFGGTGTTVPQFLHVRSFSSLENFW